MARLVMNANEALEEIKEFQKKISHLKDLLAMHRAWYATKNADDEWILAPSKIVGYHQIPADEYLKINRKIDGRKTEVTLREWFEELPEGSELYKQLYAQLSEMLAKYGKSPNKKCRISIIKGELREREEANNKDTAIVRLIAAVAKELPTEQRAILRRLLT